MKNNSWKILLWLYIPSTLILMLAVCYCYKYNVPIADLIMDPLSTMGAPTYTGIISNIGVLFWAFTVGICFFTVTVLKYRKTEKQETMRFIFFGGIITSVLLADDFFLLHDRVNKHHLGLSEVQSCSIYAVAVIVYLVRFRKKIIDNNYMLILLSLLFFTFSLVEDATELIDDSLSTSLKAWSDLIEDGPKFFGIMSWFGYFTTTCFEAVTATDQDSS